MKYRLWDEMDEKIVDYKIYQIFYRSKNKEFELKSCTIMASNIKNAINVFYKDEPDAEIMNIDLHSNHKILCE